MLSEPTHWMGPMQEVPKEASEPTLSANKAHAFNPRRMAGGLGRSPQDYVYQNESLPSAPQETSKNHKGVPQDQSGEVRSD